MIYVLLILKNSYKFEKNTEPGTLKTLHEESSLISERYGISIKLNFFSITIANQKTSSIPSEKKRTKPN